VAESNFRSGKVAESHRRDPQQHQKVVLIRLQLQLLLELFTRLWIGLFAELFEIGVAEKAGARGYFGSSLMACEILHGRLRKVCDRVRSPEQHVQGRRVPHVDWTSLNQARRLRQFFCLEVSDPEKIRGFEIAL